MVEEKIFVENPDTIHGRLLESVHTTGYTMERACVALEYLLEEDRWKQVGDGFDDINQFVLTINLSQFKIAVDNRKKLSKLLSNLGADNTKTAKALGVSDMTVKRDLGATNVDLVKNKSIQSKELKNEESTNVDSIKDEEKKKDVGNQILQSSGSEIVKQQEKEIKKAEKKENHKKNIEEQKAAIEAEVQKLPEGLFNVIVIDPPWNYGREYDPDGSRVANPYPEMTQSELLKLDIPADKDCVLFLWTTHQFIWDAGELMKAWGFEYKANFVWDKEIMGMGSWLRMQCEFCLIGIKGKPFWENTTHRDIIREKRRQHSRKPDGFYEAVENITAGRRLDYFSRTVREGWEVFGNDTSKF